MCVTLARKSGGGPSFQINRRKGGSLRNGVVALAALHSTLPFPWLVQWSAALSLTDKAGYAI
jgi:hypothetical protein